jgi:hypothetical protein
LEDEGLSTTQISLVREHSEAIKPPRALWVPFELGRPLGQPNDAEFQKRVLRACLGLLEAESGPVLEDYQEDIPAGSAGYDFTGMSCPIDLYPVPSNDSELTRSLVQEIGQIAPWYELAVDQRQRTTVGISELDILDAARFLSDFIEDPSSPSPRPEMEVGPMLKHTSEDLKAFYSEAMSAQPGMSSSLVVENWLWNETVLGKVLWNFREEHVDDPDSYIGYLAQRGLIPDRQIQLKGAPVF